MCPILAPAALQGIQAIASFQGQKQQASAVRQAAIADYERKSTEINRRQMQEDDAAAQKDGLQSLEEAQRGADAEVSAAAGGVAGVSLDNILSDVSRTGARNRETIRQNSDATAQQLQLEKKGAKAEAQSRINSAPAPSTLSLVAGLGSAALSGYNSYKKMK